MEPIVTKVWVDDIRVYIQTEDGKVYSQKFSDYYRLRNATQQQRVNFSTNRFGIHWEELDEDLSFAGFMAKKPDNIIYNVFKTHPELDVSIVARRMGIQQSLLAAYIAGAEKPSQEQKKHLEATMHEIGKSLLDVKLS